MASRWSQIVKENTIGSANTARLSDFDETDPYWFVVKENGKTLAEGELAMVKLKLDESYLYRQIKGFSRDRVTMVATITY